MANNHRKDHPNRERASWWRFDRYEIEDEFIGPAPGAAVQEYSPWDAYHETESQRRTVEPAYVPLLELARKIAYRGQDRLRPRYVPTPEKADLIREWCGEHGLLGILPALARRIVLTPYPVMSTETDLGGPARKVLAQTAYTLESGEWVRKRQAKDIDEARSLLESQKGEGHPVPEKLWPP
jgi:hypothetical protein